MARSFFTIFSILLLASTTMASSMDSDTTMGDCTYTKTGKLLNDPYSTINNTETDKQKLKVTRQLSMEYCFSVNQIRQLTTPIICGKTKLDALIALYDSCIDKHAFFTLSKDLDSEDLKAELIYFVDTSSIHEF